MRFLAVSSKICVSAAVFYSTFSLSECRADDIPEIVWPEDKIVYIYRTAIPYDQVDLKENRKKISYSNMIWIAVGIACFLYVCCGCCKLYHQFKRKRQSSSAVLMPSAPEAIDIQGQNYSTSNNMLRSSVVDFTFPGNLQDRPPDDGPPEYSSVVSQTSPNSRPMHIAVSPQVSGTKIAETPPPAYISVSPFQ